MLFLRRREGIGGSLTPEEQAMKRSGFAISAAGIWFFMSSTAGFCADLAGTVADAQHDPVPGVVITVQAPGSTAAMQALTNAQGAYRITGISSGLYDLALKSQLASCRGGTSMAYVGKQGLSVDWLCSPRTEAIALAKASEGVPAIESADATNAAGAVAGDPFGFSFPEFLSLISVGGFVAGTTIAGVVSSITAHLPPFPIHPASPSL